MLWSALFVGMPCAACKQAKVAQAQATHCTLHCNCTLHMQAELNSVGGPSTHGRRALARMGVTMPFSCSFLPPSARHRLGPCSYAAVGQMPAPRGTRAPPRRVAKPPEKQPRWLVWLAYIGIPLAVVAFIIGCGGVAVLMGAAPASMRVWQAAAAVMKAFMRRPCSCCVPATCATCRRAGARQLVLQHPVCRRVAHADGEEPLLHDM